MSASSKGRSKSDSVPINGKETKKIVKDKNTTKPKKGKQEIVAVEEKDTKLNLKKQVKHIDKKEQDLDDTYANIRKNIPLLMESVNSGNRSAIIAFAKEIGSSIARTSDIKQDLCTYYEQEQDVSSEVNSMKDEVSIGEYSFEEVEKAMEQHRKHSGPENGKSNDLDKETPDEKEDKQKEAVKGGRKKHEGKDNKRSPKSSTKPSVQGHKHGYLSKKGTLTWKKRYFVLNGNSELKWYVDEETSKVSKKAKGTIDLQRAKLADDHESPTRFIIQSGSKTFTMETKDGVDKKEWIAALSYVLDKL